MITGGWDGWQHKYWYLYRSLEGFRMNKLMISVIESDSHLVEDAKDSANSFSALISLAMFKAFSAQQAMGASRVSL
jgi:hypothetical protein